MTSNKLLSGFAILMTIQWVSTLIVSNLGLSFPAPLLGMLMLTAMLLTGVLKLEAIEDISKLLIEKMAIMFLPAGVSMILFLDILQAQIMPIGLTLVITNLIIVLVTTASVTFAAKIMGKGGDQQ